MFFMGLTVHTQYSAEIDELCNRYKYFSYLKNSTFSINESNTWIMNSSYWGYNNEEIHELQVMIIGKTGYGKSTTLNTIVGYDVFETDDISVCTKDLYHAAYRISSKNKTFLSLSDLPGIGESNYADSEYYKWYHDMLLKSHCVVYLLRADQRDFALDEVLFNELFNSQQEKNKVILAINYADKVEPINRVGGLSLMQTINLDKKVKEISKLFSVSEQNIVYYSASEHINIDGLVSKIADKLKQYVH